MRAIPRSPDRAIRFFERVSHLKYPTETVHVPFEKLPRLT